MNLEQILNYLCIWALFIPVPIINGIVREKVYMQIVGENTANKISTIILSLLFFLYAYFMLRNKILHLSYITVFLIGAFWVTLTIIFEFIFGYYVDKVPLMEIGGVFFYYLN